jgi:hypothetical protein
VADTNLRIAIKGDASGGRQILQVLQQIISQGGQASKVFSAIGQGGAGGAGSRPMSAQQQNLAQGAFAKFLLERKRGFAELGDQAKTLDRVLKQVLSQSLAQVDSRISKTTSRLQKALALKEGTQAALDLAREVNPSQVPKLVKKNEQVNRIVSKLYVKQGELGSERTLVAPDEKPKRLHEKQLMSPEQRGGLSNAILKDKALIKELGGEAGKTGRVLKEVLGRSVEDLDKKLEKSKRIINGLSDSYAKWKDKAESAASSKERIAANERMATAGRRLASVSANHKSLLDQQAGYGEEGSDRFGMLAGALGSIPGAGGLANTLAGGRLAFIAGGAGALGLGLAGIYAGVKAGQFVHGYQRDTLELRQQAADMQMGIAARSGQSVGQMQASIQHGDLITEYARQQIIDSRRIGTVSDDDGSAASFGKSRAAAYDLGERQKTIWGYLDNTARNILHPNIRQAELANADANVNAMLNEQEADSVARKKASQTRENAAISTALSRAQGLVATSNRIGLSASSIELATRNAYKSGMTPEQQQGLLEALVGAGGRGVLKTKGLYGSAITSVSGGMSGGAAATIAAIGALGGGDLLKTLRHTGLDQTVVQETLGSAVAALMGPNRTIGSMDGLVGMLSSGIDPNKMKSPEQLRMLQQNQMGLQVGDNLLKGATDWRRSVNLADAVKVMPGNNLLGQNMLANLDYATAMSLLRKDKNGNYLTKDIPIEFSSMGITRKNIEDKVRFSATRALGTYIGGTSGAGTQATKLANLILGDEYKGDVLKWRNDKSRKDGLGASEDNFRVLANLEYQIDPETFGSAEAATGQVRSMGDGSGEASRKATGGGGGDQKDVFSKAMFKQGEKFRELMEQLTTSGSKVNEMFLIMMGLKKPDLTPDEKGPSMPLDRDAHKSPTNEQAGLPKEDLAH